METKTKDEETMNLYFKRDELRRAVSDAARVTPTRTTVPISTHLLFTPRLSGYVTISGTDLRTWVSREALAVVPSENDIAPFTVNADKLKELLGRLPNGEIKMTRKAPENKIHILCGSVECSLVGLPAEEFPAKPEKGTGKTTFTVNGAEFARLCRSVMFASDDEELQPFRTVVRFVVYDGTLVAAATDTRTFAENAMRLGETVDVPEFLIPTAQLARVLPLFEDAEEVVVSVEETTATFGVDGVVWVSVGLLQTRFPNYTRVFPADFTLTQEFDREALLAVAQRAALFTSADEYSSRVFYTVSPGFLQLSVKNGAVGGFEEEIEATTVVSSVADPDSYTSDFTMGLNNTRLIDTLRVIDSPRVSIAWSTAHAMPTIAPAGETAHRIVIPYYTQEGGDIK